MIKSRTIFALACAFYCVLANATETQSIDSIVDTAKAFLESSVSGQTANAQHEISVQSPDSHLRMPACLQPLVAFIPDGYKLSGNTTVGVRCRSSKPWTLYLSVKISSYDEILVAKAYIPKGTVITDSLLMKSRRDMNDYRRGYFTDSAQLTGKVTRRAIARNAAVTPGAITQAVLIKRGQPVNILVQSDGIEISVKGKALMDGAVNDLIRAQNISSNKIVYGTVIAPGTIAVEI